MATSDISRLRSMSVFNPRRRRSISDPLSEDLSPLEPVAKAPQLDIPNISMAGITPDEPQNKFRTMLDEINAAYKPDTQDIEAYRRLRDAFPQREEPSFMRKLAASTQAWGKDNSIENIDKILNQPYNEDLLDWKEKTQPHYQLANLEGQRNIQERTLLTNTIQADYQADRNRIQEEKNRNQYEVSLIRANAQQAKVEGATVTFDRNSGRVIATWSAGPKAGQMKDLGKIPGAVSAAELAGIEGSWDVRAQEARGAAENQQIIVRGQNLFEFPDGSLWSKNPDGSWKAEKPAGTGSPTRIGTPNQVPDSITEPEDVAKAQNNRMREAYSGMPGGSTHLEPLPNGGYRMKEAPVRGYRWFESDADFAKKMKEYSDIHQYVFQGKAPAPAPPPALPGQGAAPQPPQQAAPQPPQAAAPPERIVPSANVYTTPTGANPSIYGPGTTGAALPPQAPPWSGAFDKPPVQPGLQGYRPQDYSAPPPPQQPPPQQPPPQQGQIRGVEPGYVAIRRKADGMVVQVPQGENLNNALNSGRYELVQ